MSSISAPNRRRASDGVGRTGAKGGTLEFSRIYAVRIDSDLSPVIAAWAAASRAMGTR